MTWNFSLTVLGCLTLSLFPRQFVTFSLALCSSLFLPQPLFSELPATFFILFQLLILKSRPSGPPSLPLGSVGGWGVGWGCSAGCSGHPALPQRCSCDWPANFGSWEWRGEESRLLCVLTPRAGRPIQGTLVSSVGAPQVQAAAL